MTTRDERVGAVFAALSDATRRDLVARLAGGATGTATELAAPLPVTRQAVVKHLRALGEAGLVTSRRHGREVRYELVARPLEDAVAWMVRVGGQWDHRLARLRRHMAAT